MEEVDTFGLSGVLLIGVIGIASMAFATMEIWNYFDKSPRWGRLTAGIAIGLAVVPLFLGGWILFDVLWAAKWLVRKALEE